jgi:ubiquinone/menaquinone biosynthesis C-methylase UbiE
MTESNTKAVIRAFDTEAQTGASDRRRRRYSFRLQRRWLLDHLDPPAGALLDLGCGAGVLLPDLVATGRPVIGVDGSLHAIEIARQAWGQRVRLVHADAESLPVGDAECGAVVALGLFEYLSDPRRALAEIRRVLAPGGQLLLTIPAATNPYHRVNYALSALKHRLTGSAPSIVVWRPDRRALAETVESAGFEAPLLERCHVRLLPPPLDRAVPGLARGLSQIVDPVTPKGWGSTWLVAARRGDDGTSW